MSQIANSVKLAVTTTGSDGSATGDTTSAVAGGIRGFLWSIYFDFHASAPAGTDITVTEVGGAGRTLLTLTNVNTDGSYPVRIPSVGATGAANGGLEPIALDGTQVKVAVSGSNALAPAVTAYVYILQ